MLTKASYKYKYKSSYKSEICTCKKICKKICTCNHKAYKASTKRSFVSFVLALLARSAYFALLCPWGQSIKSSYKSSYKYKSPICKKICTCTCKKLQSKVHQEKVLILLARSAYFALLSRLSALLVQKRSCNYGESIKSKICSQSSRRYAQNKYKAGPLHICAFFTSTSTNLVLCFLLKEKALNLRFVRFAL